MNNKTPYELRFDLLSFAKDHLSTAYYASLEQINVQKDLGMKPEQMPTFPTPEEIMNLAEKLKQFISKK